MSRANACNCPPRSQRRPLARDSDGALEKDAKAKWRVEKIISTWRQAAKTTLIALCVVLPFFLTKFDFHSLLNENCVSACYKGQKGATQGRQSN
jgi:hypothetical protein